MKWELEMGMVVPEDNEDWLVAPNNQVSASVGLSR